MLMRHLEPTGIITGTITKVSTLWVSKSETIAGVAEDVAPIRAVGVNRAVTVRTTNTSLPQLGTSGNRRLKVMVHIKLF